MFGERIFILRRQKGLTQTELAKLLHISTSALGMYEQGRRQPSLDTIVHLSHVFGVSVDYLLTGKQLPPKDVDICLHSLHHLCNQFRIDLCTLFSNDISSAKKVAPLAAALFSASHIHL